jgi:hypothetical protein
MEKQTKEVASEEGDPLGIALERGERFEAELRTVDAVVRSQLLSAWKELIIEEMVGLLRVTDDVLTLRCLDNQIAVGKGNALGMSWSKPKSQGRKA